MVWSGLHFSASLALHSHYHPQADFSHGNKMAAAIPDFTSALYTIWSQRKNRENLYPEFPPSPEIHWGLNKVICPSVNQPLGIGVVYWLSLDHVPHPWNRGTMEYISLPETTWIPSGNRDFGEGESSLDPGEVTNLGGSGEASEVGGTSEPHLERRVGGPAQWRSG